MSRAQRPMRFRPGHAHRRRWRHMRERGAEIVRKEQLRNGHLKITALAKFRARIVKDILLDDGEQHHREFEIEAETCEVELAEPSAFAALCEKMETFGWVVHVKPPFGGPRRVLKYLARYTHRPAISNHRLRSLENGRVGFDRKDYSHGGRKGILSLEAVEFIRRFLLHVLPAGLVRIRRFGFLVNRVRIRNWGSAAPCSPPRSPTLPTIQSTLTPSTTIPLVSTPDRMLFIIGSPKMPPYLGAKSMFLGTDWHS